MYISKYWGNYIGDTDDSLNLVAFLEDQKKEEISLSEIFTKVGLDKQNWNFRKTVEYLEFIHSNGVEIDFHFAIDVIIDLAAIMLECYINGNVCLHELDQYINSFRFIRITATVDEHHAMNKVLADFSQNPMKYDLHELIGDEDILKMADIVEKLRKELYESVGRNRNFNIKAENMKNLLLNWNGATGCFATNRIMVEGCKVGYCYREKPDGNWDSGWRFTAGNESDAYMDDSNNSSIYSLNSVCNNDPKIIPLLNTPYPCAFERDVEGEFKCVSKYMDRENAIDILHKCQKWHENNEYQKIINILETIPADERSPEMDSELARAYNNLAAPFDRKLLKKAISLLEHHEEYFKDDYYWNFRMGYSYFYLDQEGRALVYFRKALECLPDDKDTQEFISACEKNISLPKFEKCFKERVAKAWKAFVKNETELRHIMDEDKNKRRGDELINKFREILNLAFDSISFELGYNDGQYELILTPEGNSVSLFEMIYFKSHAPKEIFEHWNILVGRQPIGNISLKIDGIDVSGDDVQVWYEDRGESKVALFAYCKKLLPLLEKNEKHVWWILTTLTDQILGEIVHMRYIDSFEVLKEPRNNSALLLSQLLDKLKDKGFKLSNDAMDFIDSYLSYEMQPSEDPNADLRLDIIVGSTCCSPIIDDYLHNYNDYMDDLHADGAVAGFIYYPLNKFAGEEYSKKIFDFREQLEEYLIKDSGNKILTIIGRATGLFYGYIDFIAWDLVAVLSKAQEFFKSSDIDWANFHVFRRKASSVCLK